MEYRKYEEDVLRFQDVIWSTAALNRVSQALEEAMIVLRFSSERSSRYNKLIEELQPIMKSVADINERMLLALDDSTDLMIEVVDQAVHQRSYCRP